MHSLNPSTIPSYVKLIKINEYLSKCFFCIVFALLTFSNLNSQENIPITAGIDDNVSNLIAYDGYLFFSAQAAPNVTEIFYYNNSVPTQVSNFMSNSSPQEFTVLNGKLYLSAIKQGSTSERVLYIISPNGSSYQINEISGSEGANNFIYHDSYIYFQGVTNIFRLDPNDYSSIESIANDVGVSGLPHLADADRKRLFVAGDKLFYNKSLGIHYVDLSLPFPNSDTVNGTASKRVSIGGTYSSYHIGDKVLYNVYDANSFSPELYLIDAGQTILTPILIELSSFTNTRGSFFTQHAGNLFFIAYSGNIGWRVFYMNDLAMDESDIKMINNFEATPNTTFESSDPFIKIDGKFYHFSDEIEFVSGMAINTNNECFSFPYFNHNVISLGNRFYYIGADCIGCNYFAYNLQSCLNNNDQKTETCLNYLDNAVRYLIDLNGEIFFDSQNPETGHFDLWKWSDSITNDLCAVDCDSNQELAALQDFYDAAGGDNWINTTAGDRPWFEDCDPCGINDGTPWFGIECTILNTVDKIAMYNNNLNGEITPSIDQLTDLEWFIVGGSPMLTGSIPTEFCNLNKLLHFDVSYNNLNGMIPSCFNTIPNLVRFVARDNDLSGSLPLFGDFSQPYLKNIQVEDNELIGSIPNSLALLSNLSFLDLAGNNLSGCYDNTLLSICNNPMITSNQNENMSDGNNFLSNWEDFCATGAGQCCDPDITLDGSLISSGVYEASNSITIVGCVPASLDITLDAPTVIMDPSFKVEPGAVVTTQMIGCQ